MEKYFKDMDYEKISEEEAFNGRRVKVKIEKYYNKRDNKEVYREHIKAGNGAVIMPFLDEDTLIMIEEIRTPIGKSILAFPAGLIEAGEDPAEAAIRELEEETGYRAGEIEQIIYEYPAVGYSDEKVYIFIVSSPVVSWVRERDDGLQGERRDLFFSSGSTAQSVWKSGDMGACRYDVDTFLVVVGK